MFCDGFHVLFVAVGAYHDDACSEFGVHEFVWDYFDFSVGDGNPDFFVYVFLVALVVWVDSYCDAGWEEFGSCGGYGQVFVIFHFELNVMQCSFSGFVFYFCVSYGCFAARTPVYWMCSLVDHAFFVEKNERELGAPPVVWVHGFVFCGPVYGASETHYGFLHDTYVFVDEFFAEFDEFCWRHLSFLDAIFFFGFDFGGEAVAVPSLWKKNVVSAHSFVAGYHVKIGPVEDVSHVEVAGWIWRRSVYAVDRAGLVFPVKAVDAQLFPFPLPLLLDLKNIASLGKHFHAINQPTSQRPVMDRK